MSERELTAALDFLISSLKSHMGDYHHHRRSGVRVVREEFLGKRFRLLQARSRHSLFPVLASFITKMALQGFVCQFLCFLYGLGVKSNQTN